MTSIRTRIATGAATLAIAAGAALGATAVGTGTASADVPAGHYHLDLETLGTHSNLHAWIINGGRTIRLANGGQVHDYAFHQTPRGGWFDISGTTGRVTLRKHGRSYVGDNFNLGIRFGSAVLTPAR